MKANEAPEKLYLISDKDVVMLSYDPPTKLQGDRYDFVDKEVFPIEEGTDIEYVRKDAFIEKACDAYCAICDTKECDGCTECTWVIKFRRQLEKL